jgi:hypothetical protein
MKPRTLFVLGAILLAAVSRTIPHPWNFAPITGMALFGAAKLQDRRLALFTPLAALFISDLLIEVLYRWGLMSSWGLYEGMWIIYSAILFITLLGFVLRKYSSVVSIACVTLASSCLFFLYTNFALWVTGVGRRPFSDERYPPTVAGLLECFENALPFFQHTLLGDAIYVTVFFGGFALATRWLPALRETGPAPVGGPISNPVADADRAAVV